MGQPGIVLFNPLNETCDARSAWSRRVIEAKTMSMHQFRGRERGERAEYRSMGLADAVTFG